MAGLLPSSAEFSIIPPLFLCGTENEFVAEGINLCFRGIINDMRNNEHVVISLRNNTEVILIRCLASMINHAGSLLEFVEKYPNHSIASMPILSKKILLTL